jgi:hypothetical protein
MRARRIRGGRIEIPTVIDTPDGGIAHGSDQIGPDDPRYAAYDAWLRQQEADGRIRD